MNSFNNHSGVIKAGRVTIGSADKVIVSPPTSDQIPSGGENASPNISSEAVLFEAQLQADKIISEARAIADRLIIDAKTTAIEMESKLNDVIEARSESAMREAQKAGYELGLKQGQQKADEDAIVLLSEAKNVLKVSAEKADKILNSSEQDMLRLVIAIAEQVLDREINSDPEIILNSIRKALQKTTQRSELTLRVSPRDVATINQRNLLELGMPDIKVVGDPNLKPGDCLLDGTHGRVDATIKSQVEIIKTRLGVEEHE